MSTIVATPGLTASAPRRRQVPAPRSAARPVTASVVRPSVRPSVAAAPVRLTRRGRLALTLLFLVALTAALTMFGATSAATGEAGRPVPTRSVVVQPGDTLWVIASEVAAPGDVREMVHRIQELNAMAGPGLAVGQELAVPVG